jgi:hypothetical protein
MRNAYISVVYIVLPFTFCLYVTLRFLIHQRLTDKSISKTRFSQHNRAHSQEKVIHKGG